MRPLKRQLEEAEKNRTDIRLCLLQSNFLCPPQPGQIFSAAKENYEFSKFGELDNDEFHMKFIFIIFLIRIQIKDEI